MLVGFAGESPFVDAIGEWPFDDDAGEWPFDETGETVSPILPVPTDGANCRGVPSAIPMVAIPRVDCVVENA